MAPRKEPPPEPPPKAVTLHRIVWTGRVRADLPLGCHVLAGDPQCYADAFVNSLSDVFDGEKD